MMVAKKPNYTFLPSDIYIDLQNRQFSMNICLSYLNRLSVQNFSLSSPFSCNILPLRWSPWITCMCSIIPFRYVKAPVHKGHFERPALPGVLINVSCKYKEEHMKLLTKKSQYPLNFRTIFFSLYLYYISGDF